MNIAIIFAGGSGIRMGSGIPKQFLEINGKPILIHTIQLFQYHELIDKIYVSVLKDYIPYLQQLIVDYNLDKVVSVTSGGETAQDSIYNALLVAKENNEDNSIVLLHDGVRPFVDYDVITKNIQGVKAFGNAITCTPCNETILISKDSAKVSNVPYRKETFSAQAPQSFYLKDILAAHNEIRERPERYMNMVDACTIFTFLNMETNMIIGNYGNLKVTTPEDVYYFRALLQFKENEQAFGLGLTNTINEKYQNIKRNES